MTRRTITRPRSSSLERAISIVKTHLGADVDSTHRLQHIARSEPDPALWVGPA